MNYKFTEHQITEIVSEAYGITEQELIEVENKYIDGVEEYSYWQAISGGS